MLTDVEPVLRVHDPLAGADRDVGLSDNRADLVVESTLDTSYVRVLSRALTC